MNSLANLSVCFIAGTLGQGGAERQLYYMVKTLKSMGATIAVLTFGRGEFWEPHIRNLGVEVRWVGSSNSQLVRLFTIISIVRKMQPDIVQSQHFFVNIYSATTGRFLNLRDIGAVRANLVNEMKDVGMFGRPSLLWPRSLAVNSRAALELAAEMGVPQKRLHFLPNIVDCEHFPPMLRSSSSENITLLTIGRLVNQKRTDRFLHMLARLRNSMPETTIKGIVIGDGPNRQFLLSLAEELGLTNDEIQFVRTSGDIESFYRLADIFILTSDFEGTPNVLLEAMASALPVVATCAGDSPAIISSGENGFLIDFEDLEGAVEVLKRLVLRPDFRRKLGESAREYVLNHYSPAILPEALAALYGEI